MPENIRDHGGIEGDDSASAGVQNVAAINSASNVASDNTVFLPAGTWYISADDIVSGQAIQAGCSAPPDRGAAGLGFVGEGVDRTTLSWATTSDPNNHIRYCNADHSGAIWKDLTYTGRWRYFERQGVDFADGSQWGIKFDGGSGDFTFENVRFIEFAGNGVQVGADVDVIFNRCTFRDNAMGVHKHNDGNRHQHHISAIRGHTEVRNCYLSLASGTAIDYGSGGGNHLVENTYIEGAGTSIFKINDPDKVTIRNLFARGETQETINQVLSGSRASFFFRLGDTRSHTPLLDIQNVKVVDCPGFAMRATNGHPVEVIGDQISFENVCYDERTGLFDEALSGSDTPLILDIGDMSIHEVGGVIANLESSSGNIDNIRWDGADGLGNMGSVSTTSIRGGDKLSPTVPGKNNVGVNSSSQSGDNGSGSNGNGGDEEEQEQDSEGGLTEFVRDNSITIGVALGLASRYLGGSN